jgi:hypothetical protein
MVCSLRQGTNIGRVCFLLSSASQLLILLQPAEGRETKAEKPVTNAHISAPTSFF